jgi:hypothetical protein
MKATWFVGAWTGLLECLAGGTRDTGDGENMGRRRDKTSWLNLGQNRVVVDAACQARARGRGPTISPQSNEKPEAELKPTWCMDSALLQEQNLQLSFFTYAPPFSFPPLRGKTDPPWCIWETACACVRSSKKNSCSDAFSCLSTSYQIHLAQCPYSRSRSLAWSHR